MIEVEFDPLGPEFVVKNTIEIINQSKANEIRMELTVIKYYFLFYLFKVKRLS